MTTKYLIDRRSGSGQRAAGDKRWAAAVGFPSWSTLSYVWLPWQHREMLCQGRLSVDGLRGFTAVRPAHTISDRWQFHRGATRQY